jgi:hypothetical protein
LPEIPKIPEAKINGLSSFNPARRVEISTSERLNPRKPPSKARSVDDSPEVGNRGLSPEKVYSISDNTPD